LLSAIGRPYHGYHPKIWDKGAALLHGVSKAHGFADGNKRTALLLTLLLFEQSGYEIELRDDERFDDLVVDVVQGSMDQNALVEWLRARTIGPAY
jgi:death-on-curing protein